MLAVTAGTLLTTPVPSKIRSLFTFLLKEKGAPSTYVQAPLTWIELSVYVVETVGATVDVKVVPVPVPAIVVSVVPETVVAFKVTVQLSVADIPSTSIESVVLQPAAKLLVKGVKRTVGEIIVT
jgi:hypothetical protein